MTSSDIRHGVLLLRKSPIFAVTAVLSLSAGIAGTAAIFSLADALLFRPRIGVTHTATLVDIGRSTDGQDFDNFGYPLFEAMRAGTTYLESIAAHRLSPQVMSLGDGRSSERVYAALVSGNYFSVVGTRPALGRFFVAEEDREADAQPVIVLSHQFWQRRFAGRNVIGEQVHLNKRPYVIVGVAEAGFTGTTFIGADFWVPMAMDAHVMASDRSQRANHGSVWMTAVGRLKPGATTSQARDELQAIMHNYLRERGDDRIKRWGVAVHPSARIPPPMVMPVGGFVGVLGGLTALVLLIACSNVAGMLLARGVERRREFATRLAVGASRGRLVRQLLTEGCVLAFVAGAISIPLTYLIVGLLAAYRPDLPIPLVLDLRVDLRVLGIALMLAGLAAVGVALLPALQSTRLDLSPSLRGTHASADRRRVWLRQGLVATQVAVALLLLVVAGLFVRSLQKAATVNVGFSVDNVDTVQIDTRIGGYSTDEEGVRAVSALIDRFKQVPGVTAVGASRMIPLQGGRLGLGGLRAPGHAGSDGSDRVRADWDVVSPEYFAALHMGIVEGRPFNTRDREGAPFVAIVNQTMAERVWPGQSAIGKTLLQSWGEEGERTLTVVGIARDGKYGSVSESPRSFIFVPLMQQYIGELTFYVRHEPGPSRTNDLRQAVVAFDPMLPVIHAETLEQATALGLLPQRIAAWIAGSVASIGLFLAALGLYGLTAFSVSQRSREIAIRMAVGASHQSILRMVLRQAVSLAAIGTVVGLALAALASTLLQSLLVGLGPIDPLAFGVAFAVVGGVMLASTWSPARRAAATDPMRILRAD